MELYLSQSARVAIEQVLLPWLNSSRVEERYILAPNPATIVYLKQTLITQGESTLGVHFHTPGTLRKELMQKLKIEQSILTREQLHFLARLGVHEHVPYEHKDALNLNPEVLVSTYDALIQGDLDKEDINLNYYSKIFDYIDKHADALSLKAAKAIDHLITKSKKRPVLKSTLAFGFTCGNWEHYPSLIASREMSESFSAVFIGQESESLADSSWIGTWEEIAKKEVVRLNEEHTSSIDHLAEAFELGIEPAEATYLPEFLVGASAQDISNLIVGKTLHLCATSPEHARVGIVFPRQSSSVSRFVSSKLNELKIPHQDWIGIESGKSIQERSYEAWLTLQKERRHTDLLNFSQKHHGQFNENWEQVKEINDHLLQATAFLMTTQLDTLIKHSTFDGIDTTRWLLPQKETFANYFELTKKIFEAYEWTTQSKGLCKTEQEWIGHFKNEPINIHTWIEWLKGQTQKGGRIRTSYGSNTYAKIHLLTASQATSQEFEHTLIVDLATSEWDPISANDLISTKAKNLYNQESLKQGIFGEGHAYYPMNKGHLKTEIDLMNQAHRDFSTILRNTKSTVTLCAHAKDGVNQASAHKFIQRLYSISCGENLREDTIQSFVHASISFDQEKQNSISTRKDHPAFRFDSAPKDFEIKLSAKSWEQALTCPQRSWIEQVLKIKTLNLESNFNAITTGTWTHDWLDFNRIKKGETNLRDAVLKKAQQAKVKGSSIFGHTPILWEAYWNRAKRAALDIANKVEGAEFVQELECEYTLRETKVEVRPGINISITGRIDALAKCNNQYTVIDYKTGKQGNITQGTLKNAQGLQLVLYALAIRKHHPEASISLSIIKPNSNIKEPVDLELALGWTESLWDKVEKINDGHFGYKENTNFELPMAFYEL